MTNSTSPEAAERLTTVLRQWGRIATVITIAVPCTVLIGWTFGIESLMRILPGLVAMNPVTALTFIVLGAGLAALRQRAAARTCAIFAGLTGALVLLRYASGWDLGIDTALFPETAAKNLMAPTTAGNFVLGSIALWLVAAEGETARRAQPFAIGVGVVSLVALTGYAYGVEKLYRPSKFIAMAVHTAGNFLIFSSALLSLRPDAGLMLRLTSRRAGGAMLRRFFPVVIAVPFLFGWLIVRVHRTGEIDTPFAVTVFAMAIVVFLAAMLWRGARLLDREDMQRADVEGQLREAHADLEKTVRQRTAELQQTVGGIREELEILAAAGREILALSSGLATSASETARSVSATTATVEEVRQGAQLAAENARRVAASARLAVGISTAGTAAARATAEDAAGMRAKMLSIGERMAQLNECNHAIGEIVAVVDELAEQSNLLAVNAAIEAAAAREQGQGFAVVAQEMRYLSDQSRQATRQVRGILTDIQRAGDAATATTGQATQTVEAAVTQAARAGEAILGLENRVGEAAQMAAEIAATSAQQLTGMNHVGAAMEQIKAASDEHAGAAHRLETAARDLHALGLRLKELAERHQA